MPPYKKGPGRVFIAIKAGRYFRVETEPVNLYCELRHGKQMLRTSECYVLPGQSPEWVEGYHFDVSTLDPEIEVRVFKKYAVGDVKEVGEFYINLRPFENKPPIELWQLVENKPENCKAEILFGIHYVKKAALVSESDFTIIRLIGRGTFGKVYLARKKDNKKLYAIKKLRKDKIIDMGTLENALNERQILKTFKHPFIVGLAYTFQTKTHLTQSIQQTSRIAHLTIARYRDLKLENLLLDTKGNVVLCDFGLSTENYDSRRFTVCGSTAYMAPEIITGTGYSKEVDWWALGAIMYQMLVGKPPFYTATDVVTLKDQILAFPIEFPTDLSPHACSFLTMLLHRNPSKRLGSGDEDYRAVKQHPFFESVDWTKLIHKEEVAPIMPILDSPTDTRYFEDLSNETTTSVVETEDGDEFPAINRNFFGSFSYSSAFTEELFSSPQQPGPLQQTRASSFPLFSLSPRNPPPTSPSPRGPPETPRSGSRPTVEIPRSGGSASGSPAASTSPPSAHVSPTAASASPRTPLQQHSPINYNNNNNQHMLFTPSSSPTSNSSSPSALRIIPPRSPRSPRHHSPRPFISPTSRTQSSPVLVVPPQPPSPKTTPTKQTKHRHSIEVESSDSSGDSDEIRGAIPGSVYDQHRFSTGYTTKITTTTSTTIDNTNANKSPALHHSPSEPYVSPRITKKKSLFRIVKSKSYGSGLHLQQQQQQQQQPTSPQQQQQHQERRLEFAFKKFLRFFRRKTR